MRLLKDPIDGYEPATGRYDEKVRAHLDAVGWGPPETLPIPVPPDAPVEHRDQSGPWGALGSLQQMLRLDGYQNTLTGLGDWNRDKTYGGNQNGPTFVNEMLSGWEAQERWRGSDLGGRIVETFPREMTRKGWTVAIQPEPDDDDGDVRHDAAPIDYWRKADAFPAPPPKAPTHKPEELSQDSDENAALVEALRLEQERLGLARELELALAYERNYGGAGILLGVDDGAADLTQPLDWSKVERISFLSTFRGGWDGELIAWRYYQDPRSPRFGDPEIYQLRNLGVPVSSPPAPGEGLSVATPQQMPRGPAGALIFFVHESRFLVFDGDPKSRWARVIMRGWGDSVWMRINRILAQYSGAWDGLATLLQEFGAPILKMKGFTDFMASKDANGLATISSRAVAMQMAMSIAKVRILDDDESLERLQTSLAGVPEVMREFALRIAAAAGMPYSMLMGQVQGGLGDASKGDISFFDDQVVGLQAKKLTPQLQRFIGLQFAAKSGVSKGRTPSRWSVSANPQREMTPDARSKYYQAIATADDGYIQAGVVTPEEVAATRFGGSKFNDGPIVLDFEERAAAKASEIAQPPEPGDEPPQNPPGVPRAPGDAPQGAKAGLTSQEPHSSLKERGSAAQAPTGTPTKAAPPPHHDAADFVTRNGRVKVRTACSVVVPFGPDGRALMGVNAESGKLAFPGGHAEPGEDALSTAVRELHEETGLHPKRISLIGTKTVGGPVAQTHVSVYRALVEGEPTNAGDPDKEFSAFRWVDLSSGQYPEDVDLHHENDVVGPMLRRR